MKMVSRFWVLPLLMCSVLSVAAFADGGHADKKRHKNVPEGGSSVAYLSLAAVACIGAVTLKSRKRETAKAKS